MVEASPKNRRRGPVALTELVGKVLQPVTAERGFAKAELVAAWPAIVGPAHAQWTAPEKIAWPRPVAGAEQTPGVLILRVDGPRAIFVQHELPQIIERVNAFLGYRAIDRVKIVQGPVRGEGRHPAAELPALGAVAEAELSATLSDVADDSLRAALDRLGRGVLAKGKARGRSP